VAQTIKNTGFDERRYEMSSSPLLAGVSKADITPKLGTHLSGSVADFRPALEIGDPLFARALVLEAGDQKLCMVVADLTIITKERTDPIRRRIADALSISTDAVMIHATQTHSAPSIGCFILSEEFPGIAPEIEWLKGSESDYNALIEECLVETAIEASKNTKRVDIGAGSAVEGRWAFNRRAVKRDGSVFMPWRTVSSELGMQGVLYMEGPIDPELGVVALKDESGDPLSIITNYTCHPVHVFPKQIVSADWPGALADSVQEWSGDSCIPIVTNGACGDVNPWPTFDPDYVEDHNVMGASLSEMAQKVYNTLEYTGDVTLGYDTHTLDIPLREIDPQALAEARAIVNVTPDPPWNEQRTSVDLKWVMSAGLVDLANLKERQSTDGYEIQIFRIGDVALVGLPGEPFAEGGLRIKLDSPTPHTYIVHDVNQYVGYLPTKRAFPRGGHECTTGNWSRLVPEALDTVVEKSVEMLHGLFDR